jgi:hypothetical protein
MEDLLWSFAARGNISRELRDQREEIRARFATKASLEDLQERIGRLTLATTAMWRILQDRLGVRDVDLLEMIMKVDLEDGRRDGQHNPKGLDCPKCKRTNHLRHSVCLYCAEPLGRKPLP